MPMATRLIEIGSIDIEAIKDQHPLASIVEPYVALKRRAGKLEGLCPFHEERTPSFKIYEQDQRYHCFGCGAHGDAFDFLEHMEGLDLRGAAERITGGTFPTYSPERIEELRAKRAAFEAQEAAARDSATLAARERWMAADPAYTEHPYLARKGIGPNGTRLAGDRILIPLIGADGRIQTVQSIDPTGRKLFETNAPVSGGLFVLGGKVATSEQPVLVCEGFATAATLHEATDWVTVCAFNSGNLLKVAARLAERYPDREYIVAGDDDRGKEKNVGRAAAIEAAALCRCRVTFPEFPAGSTGTDFNDMAEAYGKDAVRNLIIDGVLPSGEPEPEAPKLIKATQFVLRDAGLIPKRRWLYGRHLLRKFVSADAAAGALGKSSLKLVEALAMVTNVPLLGKTIHEGPLRVWLYNLEDPYEESERRIAAACLHYGIDPDALGGRLYVDSGRDQPCITAEETANGAVIVRPIMNALIETIQDRKIDVLILDPFVSSHAVNENDNNKIDMIVKEWGRVSEICDCSINLVHHVRKGNGDETSADSVRGAKALIDGVRSTLVYNRMTRDEALSAGLQAEDRRFYFRTHNDKANLAPPEAADWYKMINVDLPNGDGVGVATPWDWPDVFAGISNQTLLSIQQRVAEGEYRSDARSPKWIGRAVADVLDLDVADPASKKQIGIFIATWVRNKAFKTVVRKDEKRMDKEFVEVAEWVAL